MKAKSATGRKMRAELSAPYPKERPNSLYSKRFGLTYSNREELSKALAEGQTRGLYKQQDNEMTKFWKLSMDMLKAALHEAAAALAGNFPNDSLEFNKKIKFFEDALSTISWTDNDITLSPTEFYNKFFAYCLNIRSLLGNPKANWRDLYEHIGASQQCAAAARKLNEIIIDWNTCYICGQKILDQYNPEAKLYAHDTRECEHVLPAFTALGYKGLIQTSKIDVLPGDVLQFFKYEYANAHRCCNQIKLDDKWIMYDERDGQYKTDTDMLTATLTNIHREKQKYDCKNIDFKIKSTNDFVTARRAFIVRNFLDKLLAIINRDKTDYGDLFDLNIRIKQVSALKENINAFAHSILTGEPAPPPRPVKEIDSKQAKLLAYKQFKDPITLFFDVFNDMFANINPNPSTNTSYVEIFWSQGRPRPLRNLVSISRKLFDEAGGKDIKDRILAENINELETVLPDGTGEDEDKIISLNNTYLLKLKSEYRHIIFEMARRVNISILEIPETDKQSFMDRLHVSTVQDQQQDDILSNEESQNAQSIVEHGTEDSAKGGNKKNILSNYMVGGEITDEELEQSYKDDILETAEKMHFDPSAYGINVQTTQSGRTSKPSAVLSYDEHGRQGIQIGREFFTLTDDGQFIQDSIGKKYQVVSKPGMGRGIYDDRGNFYSIGGKKNKSKINKKGKRNKTKKYLHKRKNVINRRVYRNKSVKKKN
jgi:hypothetical protein